MSWQNLLKAKLREFLGLTPPKPKLLTILGVKELTVLRYTFTLPPEPSIDDFDHREANVAIEGSESDVHTIAKGETTFKHDFDRDKNVTITLVDVDTSGNKSAPSEPLTFTTTDTVPPPAPGTLSVQGVEQV
jgi:hypothetical protein